MGLIVIDAATEEPITLAEACAQCKVVIGDDDATMAIAIAGSRAHCENLTQHALTTRTLEQTLDAFPCGELVLAARPVQSIVSVKYLDSAGTLQTLSPSAYEFDGSTESRPRLVPAYGTTWPQTRQTINAVRIQFVAGFGDDSTAIPGNIRSWLLMTAAFLYANREAMDLTGKTVEVPSRFVDSLLDEWRYYGG